MLCHCRSTKGKNLDAKERAERQYEVEQSLKMMLQVIQETNPQRLLPQGASNDPGGLQQRLNQTYITGVGNIIEKCFEIAGAKGDDALMLLEGLNAQRPPAPSYDSGLSGLRHSVGSSLDGQPGEVPGRSPSSSKA